jgi:hypothetical protein
MRLSRVLIVATFLVGVSAIPVAAAPIAPPDPKLVRATVQLVDLPMSWSESVADPGDEDDATFEFCGVKLARPLSLNVSQFNGGDSLLPLFSAALRFPSGEAHRLLKAIRPKMAKGCTKTLDSGLEDVTPVTFTYRSRSVPRLGDESLGFQTTKQSLFGVKATMFRKGDVLVMVSSAPTMDVDRIAAKIAVRLSA